MKLGPERYICVECGIWMGESEAELILTTPSYSATIVSLDGVADDKLRGIVELMRSVLPAMVFAGRGDMQRANIRELRAKLKEMEG